MQARMVIITGHPGSGKTSIGRQLSKRDHIPFISKDAIKERIFDGLGAKDKQWSLAVSGVAHRIMDDMVYETLRAGSSVIIESNFKPEIDSQRFSAIAEQCGVLCVQILCVADGSILFERWQQRIASGERHEGHTEEISLEQIRKDLAEPYRPLDLPGRLIRLDTSDFFKLELPDIYVTK